MARSLVALIGGGGLALLLAPVALAAPLEITRANLGTQVAAARQIVATCNREGGDACAQTRLPPDEDVRAEGSEGGFHLDWGWLRDALDAARTSAAPQRQATLQAADDRLAETALAVAPLQPTAAGEPDHSASGFPAAHAAAAHVLASNEFRAEAGPSWLDRQVARLQDALLRLFSGMGRIGARNAWLAPLIEWICFALAAAGLLFFLRRSLQRQALRISPGKAAAALGNQQFRDVDWAGRAAAAEAAGDWREAIHCLYWAAIAALEARAAWRPNPTRTPRDYLPLLRPGSETQQALRTLTRRFERSWYGMGNVNQDEVQDAKKEWNALRAGALLLGKPRDDRGLGPRGTGDAPHASTPSPGAAGHAGA